MDSRGRAKVRVLVVDDNPGTVTATVKYLEACGHAARGAASGNMALQQAAQWPPDVVILDLGLPDMDGFTVLARLKDMSAERAVTFMALSGRSDEETKQRAQAAGFSHYLVKPVRLDALVKLLPRAPA